MTEEFLPGLFDTTCNISIGSGSGHTAEPLISTPECMADSMSNPPTGIIQLADDCVLEAVFGSGYYDAFNVIDPAPLRAAIEKVHPWAATQMKRDLHMTVSYPSKRRVPGLSEEYAQVFRYGQGFPAVKLRVREICVSDCKRFGAAVVTAVESAVLFSFDDNGTPAHLTLWGECPELLIGRPIMVQQPFICVTEERFAAYMAAKLKEIDDLKRCESGSGSNTVGSRAGNM
eukprot:gene15215-10882_t